MVALTFVSVILVIYIVYLRCTIKIDAFRINIRDEIIKDLQSTQKIYHNELRDEVLSMIAADCTFEEITEYLQNT